MLLTVVSDLRSDSPAVLGQTMPNPAGGPSRGVSTSLRIRLSRQKASAPIFITDFLQPYLFPPGAGKQNTVPEWIFNVSPDDRANLDSLQAFPLTHDDLEERISTPPPQTPPLPAMSTTVAKGKQKASASPPDLSFPQPGQIMPLIITPDDFADSSFEHPVWNTNAAAVEDGDLDVRVDVAIADDAEVDELEDDDELEIGPLVTQEGIGFHGGETAEGLQDASQEHDELQDPRTGKRRRIAHNHGQRDQRDRMALFSQSSAPSSQLEAEEEQYDDDADESDASVDDQMEDNMDDDDLSEYSRRQRQKHAVNVVVTNAAASAEAETDHLPVPHAARRSLQPNLSDMDVEMVEKDSSLEEAKLPPQFSSPEKSTPKSKHGSQPHSQSQDHTESFDASDPSNEAFSLSRYEKRQIQDGEDANIDTPKHQPPDKSHRAVNPKAPLIVGEEERRTSPRPSGEGRSTTPTGPPPRRISTSATSSRQHVSPLNLRGKNQLQSTSLISHDLQTAWHIEAEDEGSHREIGISGPARLLNDRDSTQQTPNSALRAADNAGDRPALAARNLASATSTGSDLVGDDPSEIEDYIPPPPTDLPMRYRTASEVRSSPVSRAFTPRVVDRRTPFTPVLVHSPTVNSSKRSTPSSVDHVDSRERGGATNEELTTASPRVSSPEGILEDLPSTKREKTRDRIKRPKLGGFVLNLQVAHGISEELVQSVLRVNVKEEEDASRR